VRKLRAMEIHQPPSLKRTSEIGEIICNLDRGFNRTNMGDIRGKVPRASPEEAFMGRGIDLVT
jgi:hypothetical protein